MRPSRAAASQNSSRKSRCERRSRAIRSSASPTCWNDTTRRTFAARPSDVSSAASRLLPASSGAPVGVAGARRLAVEEHDQGRVGQRPGRDHARELEQQGGRGSAVVRALEAEALEGARIVGRGQHEELRRSAGDRRLQVHQLLRRAVRSRRPGVAALLDARGRVSRARCGCTCAPPRRSGRARRRAARWRRARAGAPKAASPEKSVAAAGTGGIAPLGVGGALRQADERSAEHEQRDPDRGAHPGLRGRFPAAANTNAPGGLRAGIAWRLAAFARRAAGRLTLAARGGHYPDESPSLVGLFESGRQGLVPAGPCLHSLRPGSRSREARLHVAGSRRCPLRRRGCRRRGRGPHQLPAAADRHRRASRSRRSRERGARAGRGGRDRRRLPRPARHREPGAGEPAQERSRARPADRDRDPGAPPARSATPPSTGSRCSASSRSTAACARCAARSRSPSRSATRVAGG